MKIVLATGIYPPDIGGPATYTHALAVELKKRDIDVIVVTYARKLEIRNSKFETNSKSEIRNAKQDWEVVRVSKSGGSFVRWWRYARALRKHADDADAVIAFSSVSVGVPLRLARLKGPKTILRLGGDFFWERYTDRGGMKTLREWYASKPLSKPFMERLLRTFDVVVFSTEFQQRIYEEHYKCLPEHCTIENAVPKGVPTLHTKRDPFRLLFMGRFVGFKNLPALLEAVARVNNPVLPLRLVLIGDGPMKPMLEKLVKKLQLHDRVIFLPPVHGEEKWKIFVEHDLLVLPSLTEISPNVALEACAAGLPVLLTKETGLSEELRKGMIVRDLSSPERILSDLQEVAADYPAFAAAAAAEPPRRGWAEVAEEWLSVMS